MIFKEIDNMKDVGAICHYLLILVPANRSHVMKNCDGGLSSSLSVSTFLFRIINMLNW